MILGQVHLSQCLKPQSSQVDRKGDGDYDPTEHQERQPGLQEAHKAAEEQRPSNEPCRYKH